MIPIQVVTALTTNESEYLVVESVERIRIVWLGGSETVGRHVVYKYKKGSNMNAYKQEIDFYLKRILKSIGYGLSCLAILFGIAGFAVAEESLAAWKKCSEAFDDFQYSQAYEIVENLLEKSPDHQDYLVMKVKCLTWTNRLEEAMPLWEQLLEQYPNDALIKAEWAMVLTSLSRKEEALKVVDSLAAPDVEQNFRILYNKAVVLGTTERVSSQELLDLIHLGLQKYQAPELEQTNLVRNFLLHAARLFYGRCYYDKAASTLEILCQKYPQFAMGHIYYANLCFIVNSANIPFHLQKAKDCPDFAEYEGCFLSVQIAYYYEIEKDVPKTLEILEIVDKKYGLSITLKFLQLILQSQVGCVNEQEWNHYLKTTQPENEEEKWILFGLQLELFRQKGEWEKILHYLESHPQYREACEEEYLVLKLYAKYMLDNQEPPCDEKVYLMKYHREIKVSLQPDL